MASITQTCTKCTRQFLVIDQEQQFLKDKNLPHPTMCPSCRQLRRLTLRGGRQLFKAKCQQCQKDIVTAYDPAKTQNMVLCKEDYDKYWLDHDPIINEPLPE